FTSQLARTRRRAATIAGACLGVAYLFRMVADVSPALGWLRWASPLGWVEEIRPLVGTHLLPLAPIGVFTVGLAVVAVQLAGARDMGDSILPESDAAPPRTRLLNSPTGLGLRLLRPTTLSWLVAVAGLGFVEGLIAKGAAAAVTGSAAVERALGRLGGRNGGVVAYLGLSFLISAIALTLVAAGQTAANREEEATGRLDNLLVRPVGRWSWLAGRLGVEAGILAALGLVAGAATWVGAATQHSGVGFGSLLQGGLNAVPPAMLLLGIGTLVHGALPRLVTPVTYGLIAWSFLIEFVGSVINTSHWVLDTSILYHLAPAPAAPPRWGTAAAMVALGAAGALGGAALFRRRDLISA
ncbi:MAG: polyether ionophore transport system permease protein, partial [Actinomycetota bacterium]|nr:polyether ionophore transport system permease protein [Actinomycetota bacterium]